MTQPAEMQQTSGSCRVLSLGVFALFWLVRTRPSSHASVNAQKRFGLSHLAVLCDLPDITDTQGPCEQHRLITHPTGWDWSGAAFGAADDYAVIRLRQRRGIFADLCVLGSILGNSRHQD